MYVCMYVCACKQHAHNCLYLSVYVQSSSSCVCPVEQFDFKSQRHVGYPFSATFYVNGIMAGRISSCCEYRYTPGAHQGRKSCFKLTRLAGGKPCYRSVSYHKQLSNTRFQQVQDFSKMSSAVKNIFTMERAAVKCPYMIRYIFIALTQVCECKICHHSTAPHKKWYETKHFLC